MLDIHKKHTKKSVKTVVAGVISANLLLFLILWGITVAATPIINEMKTEALLESGGETPEKITMLLVTENRGTETEEENSVSEKQAVFFLAGIDNNGKIVFCGLPPELKTGDRTLFEIYDKNGGAAALKALNKEMGLNISAWAAADKIGFISLVNQIGMARTELHRSVISGGGEDGKTVFPKGENILDGEQIYDLFFADFSLEGGAYRTNLSAAVFAELFNENITEKVIQKYDNFIEAFY